MAALGDVGILLEEAPVGGANPEEEDKRGGAPRASARAVTLNVVTGGFGLGIFSLPWSTAGASLLPAFLLIVAVVALNGFTVNVLIEGSEKHQAFDLGALFSYLPSRVSAVAQAATNAAVWAVLFLTQVGYTNVMSNAVMSVSKGSFLHDRPLTIVLVSLLVLPLCFFDQRNLAFTSALAVTVNLYIFVLMCFQPKHAAHTCMLGFGRGLLAMISVMMQAVVIQMCVLPMYKELAERSPAKFRRVVLHSFSILALIFAAFSIVGYITFGPRVGDNILDSLPQNASGDVARVGAGLCMAAVYPIFEQAMVAPVLGLNVEPRRRRLLYGAATVLTVACIMTASFWLKSIGILNIVSGVVCSIVFVALCPSVVGLFLLGARSRRWRAGMYVLFLTGTLAGILGLVYKDNYERDIEHNCAWTTA